MRGRLRVCVALHAADNFLEDYGCSALAQALPHLSALYYLNVRRKLILLFLFGLIVL